MIVLMLLVYKGFLPPLLFVLPQGQNLILPPLKKFPAPAKINPAHATVYQRTLPCSSPRIMCQKFTRRGQVSGCRIEAPTRLPIFVFDNVTTQVIKKQALGGLFYWTISYRIDCDITGAGRS